ncbi:MAG: DUF2970 domain-containing protein [Moraxellaceae bacterium]
MTDDNMTNDKKSQSPATDNQSEEKQGDITFLTVLGSVFRSWFGVQKEANRQRDFSSNSPMPFIVAGIVFFIVMIVGVIIAVKLALAGSGV